MTSCLRTRIELVMRESIQINWINPDMMSEATIKFQREGILAPGAECRTAGYRDDATTDLIWAEIPTVFDHVANDIYYFRATTPGFSNFAVSVRKNVTAAGIVNTTTIPMAATTIISTITKTSTPVQ